MEQTIAGKVTQIEGIQSLNIGFKQIVILYKEEKRDMNDKLLAKEEYYQVNIWCKEQTDPRFLSPSDKGKELKGLCNLKGERWLGQRQDYIYSLKINLKSWV